MKAFILFSMLTGSTQEFHPYRITVTQLVLKRLILVSMEIDRLLQNFSSFQKAVHARALLLVMPLMLVATIDTRYLKLDTCLICCSHTSSGDWGCN